MGVVVAAIAVAAIVFGVTKLVAPPAPQDGDQPGQEQQVGEGQDSGKKSTSPDAAKTDKAKDGDKATRDGDSGSTGAEGADASENANGGSGSEGSGNTDTVSGGGTGSEDEGSEGTGTSSTASTDAGSSAGSSYDSPSATQASTSSAKNKKLTSYYKKLRKQSKRLKAFVDGTYNADLFKSLATREADYEEFKDLRDDILGILTNSKGNWSVTAYKVPKDMKQVKKDLTKASNLLYKRLSIIEKGYKAINALGKNASRASIQKASDRACGGSQSAYDSFQSLMRSIKNEL